MFYVGISTYYSIGEGCTIYVASGSEESIRKSIPEYFHRGLTILTPAEWLKVASGECEDEYHQYNTEILQASLPILWKQIEERALGRGGHIEFFMKHHFNYA
jgi:hypothetical protein